MQHSAPLGIASSFTVIALDWILFAQVSSAPASAGVATLVMAALAALLSYLFEATPSAFAPRSLRALGAGLAVAIPLPFYGTLLALASAAWTLATRRTARVRT